MRLIDAFTLAEEIESLTITVAGKPASWNDAKHSVLRMIAERATVDAVEVAHGRWLKTREPLGWQDVDCVECSQCRESWIFDEEDCFEDMWLWKYCPNCGAKMVEG